MMKWHMVNNDSPNNQLKSFISQKVIYKIFKPMVNQSTGMEGFVQSVRRNGENAANEGAR
jgi:hypothetical protein